MTKNEALRDEIADMLENLDERGLNKWGRADAIIDRLAEAWEHGAHAGSEFGYSQGLANGGEHPAITPNPYRA